MASCRALQQLFSRNIKNVFSSYKMANTPTTLPYHRRILGRQDVAAPANGPFQDPYQPLLRPHSTALTVDRYQNFRVNYLDA